MLFAKRSVSDLLYNSKKMLDIASGDEFIKTSLQRVEFDEEKFNGLQALWNTANEKTRDYTAAVGSQKENKLRFKNSLKEAREIYMLHVRLGRSVCRKDPERMAKLALAEPRIQKFNDWLLQGTDFYVKLKQDDELMARYETTYGVSKEKLLEGEQKLLATNNAREAYQTAMGNTQALKLERDKALKDLDNGITDFSVLCEFALKDNTQQLEKMGIRVYSPGYKKVSKDKTGEPVEKKEENGNEDDGQGTELSKIPAGNGAEDSPASKQVKTPGSQKARKKKGKRKKRRK